MVFRGTGTINFAQGEMALFTTYIAWGLTTKNILCAVPAHRHNCWLHSRGGDRAGPRAADRETQPARHAHRAPRALPCPQLARRHLVGKPEPLDAEPVPNGVNSFISVDGARLYWANLGVWLLVALLVGAMFQLFNRTRLGLHMRATASNRESAALAGIPTGRILLLGWGISAAIGAVAGVLFTPLNPDALGLGEMFPLLIYASAAASSVASTRRVGPSSPAS